MARPLLPSAEQAPGPVGMFPCQTEPQTCELVEGCEEPAVAFGGFQGPNNWAGYACLTHAETTEGFQVWRPAKSVSAS